MSGRVLRAERRAEAERLRAEGLTYRVIGERMGLSRSYVGELLKDPDARQVTERRLSYGRPCADCGRPTDGSSGRDKAPLRCIYCTSGRTPPTPVQEARRCTECRATRLHSYNSSGVCGACTVELSRRRVAQALAASRQKDEAA